MYSFPELIKKIRGASGLTQKEFAEAIQVSTVLVSMIEAGQKDVSKNFIIKLSDKLGVNPSSITPFLYIYKDIDNKGISKIEKTFINLETSKVSLTVWFNPLSFNLPPYLFIFCINSIKVARPELSI